MTTGVRAGQSVEVRVPMCTTLPSEKVRAHLGDPGKGSGPAEELVQIRHMRVLPMVHNPASRECDSVIVAQGVT